MHPAFHDRGRAAAGVCPFILFVGFSVVYWLQNKGYLSPTIAPSDIINITNYNLHRQIFGQSCAAEALGAARQSNLNKALRTAMAGDTCTVT